jgi:hypothetical protein
VDGELPKRPKEHVVGDQGARILQSALPVEWVYRDLEGKGDYGIDAEIEIFDAEVPTGISFRVQLRSHGSCLWNAAGEYVQPVAESTRNYWRLQTSPVVVIVCDVASGRVCWTFPDEAETKSGVRVLRRNVLPDSANILRRGVADRLNVLGPQSLLLMAPVLERYWTELAEATGGDSFLPIDEEMLASVKMVYAQLPLLRYALALAPASLVPWDVWVAKSRIAFADYYEIYWAVFDEIIEYLRPTVTETLDLAAQRLAARDPLAGDVTAINWAQRRLGRNLSYGYSPSFEGDRNFWEGFDAHLAARGVRRISATDAFDSSKKRSSAP